MKNLISIVSLKAVLNDISYYFIIYNKGMN